MHQEYRIGEIVLFPMAVAGFYSIGGQLLAILLWGHLIGG